MPRKNQFHTSLEKPDLPRLVKSHKPSLVSFFRRDRLERRRSVCDGTGRRPKITLFLNDRQKRLLSGQWYATGITDASGTVKIKTQGKFAGIATGDYKVMISKTVSSDPKWMPADDSATPPPEIVHVAPRFGSITTTPLACSVKEGANEFTFDVQPPGP